MHAIVVGAGIVGVTSAAALADRGFEVTVVEAAGAPAEGTSRANAAQLCWPFALPLGGPGFLRALPKSLMDRRSGVGIAPATALASSEWGLRFIRECGAGRARANSNELLALARRSEAALGRLLERHPIEFAFRLSGKLALAPTPEALRAAEAGLGVRREAGFDVRALDRDECVSVEPALAGARHGFAGGIYAPDSAVGDCRAFTVALAQRLARDGVAFRFGDRVTSIELARGRVAGVRVGGETVAAGLVVLANGTGAQRLLPRFPGREPIAPLRGYSVTLPLGPRPPERTVSDPARAVAICRLGERLRVTGGAELAGAATPRRDRIARIMMAARGWFPEAADWEAVEDERWSGLRPTTPSSRPMIGAAGAPGLYVNAGHGSLGWTLSAGSAERLVECIAERPSATRAGAA